MESIIFIVSLFFALVLTPMIISAARKWQFFEQNDERKTHTEQVSSLGGAPILMACLLAVALIIQPGPGNPIMAFLPALPLFAIGLIDDVYKTGVTIRFVLQALAGVMLFEMGIQIIEVEGYWLINLGATVLFTMLMINAYNFVDGINGLAGGLGLIGSLIFGCILASNGDTALSLFCFAYAGSLLGFLVFNFGKKARIFMGDNGSTVLGFCMAVMAMSVWQSGGTDGAGIPGTMVAAIIAIPVVDLFKVTLLRVARLQSPFTPDRTHIHHLFTDKLLSHPAACVVLYTWTLLLAGATYYVPEAFTIPITLGALTVPYVLAAFIRKLQTITTLPSAAQVQESPV